MNSPDHGSHRNKTACSNTKITAVLDQIYRACIPERSGELAKYIPELSEVDPEKLAIAIATTDGGYYPVGDDEFPLALESLSKPFVYGVALQQWGREAMMEKVGVSVSGMPFDSIIDPVIRRSPLQNPMGNAGAMVTNSLIKGKDHESKWRKITEALTRYIGRTPKVNQRLFDSEMKTNFRNRSLAFLYKSYGLFYGDVDDAIIRYTKACSLMVTTRELAIMGATLANDGINPMTHVQAIESRFVRDILSVMLIYGLYDENGRWIFEIGLPGKSGVSGGMLAVVPGRLAIAAYSPRLDPSGNSIRARMAIKALVDLMELHLLDQR